MTTESHFRLIDTCEGGKDSGEPQALSHLFFVSSQSSTLSPSGSDEPPQSCYFHAFNMVSFLFKEDLVSALTVSGVFDSCRESQKKLRKYEYLIRLEDTIRQPHPSFK
jgi:hypothetical protein